MAADWVRYANQGATRSQPLDPRLIEAFQFLPEMGLAMEVFSGGQPARGSGLPRVGSERHDHGNAADVFFMRDGQRLSWENPEHLPIFQDVVRRAKASGVTGFGAGPGYMQPGSMHVGFGKPAVWGAGGDGANAPAWLREAFGSAPAGQTPQAVASPAGAPPARSFGDLVAPAAPVAPAPFGDIVARMQQGRLAQEQQAAAEQERRAALASLFV